MKLKKLEILGFKSFRDKTLLHFSDGISTIVGPNGCGKSNIVDAIRWVMGEQRVTVLRGKRMDDVIFNGSDDASAVGMAEVSITLENDGHNIPEKYSQYSEIKISRKIFREGENEYYINKTPCRLLDIREFFMDAGVGTRTYSIVEQERISKLVEAKPEERRQFIEEAAGIIKYKTRKESALRKMDLTRQNLTRLNDIVREVKSQMNSISRQAKKAERYKVLRKDLKETKLALSLQAYSELLARLEEHGNSRNSLNSKVLESETVLKGLEAEIEDIKTKLVESEGSIGLLQERFYNVKNEITIKEQEIKFSKRKIEDLETKKETSLEEIEILKERGGKTEKEIESLKLQETEIEEKIALEKNSIDEIQSVVDVLRDEERKLGKELDDGKTKHIDIITENARLKNILLSLIKGIEDLKKKTEAECREIEENRKKLGSLRDDMAVVNSDLSADIEENNILRAKEKSVRTELEKAKNDLLSTEEEIEKIKEKMGIKSSRLISLKELKENHEWCNEGTRSILKAKGAPGLPKGEIYGLVADHIDVSKEYEVAVEAALGERLQYIIVKNQKDGIKAIDYLKNRSSGRGSFIPLEMRNTPYSSELPDYLKGTVKLIDQVHATEDGYRQIIEYLLRDVLLIPNLNTGMQMWRRNGFTGTYVTPDGDIISPNGILTGGSGEVNGGSSLLRNKREMAELEREIDGLKTTLGTRSKKQGSIKSLISKLNDQSDDVRMKIHESELNINSKKKDLERLEGEIKWVDQRINVLTFNMENLASEEAGAKEKIKSIKEEITSHESELTTESEKISSLQKEWENIKIELEKREEELVDKRILLTSLEEKKKATVKTLASMEGIIIDIDKQIKSSIEGVKTSEISVEDIAERIREEERNLEVLYENHERIEKELGVKRESRGNEEVTLKEKEAEAQKARKTHEYLSKELGKLDVELTEVKIQIDALKDEISDKYSLDLDTLISEFTLLSEQETEELKRKFGEARKRLEDFGEVNLLALSEHEQLKERYDFLTTQVSDLNSSLDSLQKTISRINQITKKRFSETFEEVSNCFKTVFPRLFPGGRGMLHLTDESNLLETGVDIDIHIPGKKRQNLSLLSGGEKALSAVALIFSILMYRPTPFLILDEADAPLDDTNISLFGNLLKDLSSNSQIISITHNKNTMETSDNLIGVTMERNGISTIVSVSLN
jgi:chromosome segregation protein